MSRQNQDFQPRLALVYLYLYLGQRMNPPSNTKLPKHKQCERILTLPDFLKFSETTAQVYN